MKTFNQSMSESKSGDALYNLKLSLIEWWKTHANSDPKIKASKKELEKDYNTVLTTLDKIVDTVYEK